MQEEWGQMSKSPPPTPRCLLAWSSAVVTGQGVQVTGVAEVCDPLCSPRVSGCVRLSRSGAKWALSPTLTGPLCVCEPFSRVRRFIVEKTSSDDRRKTSLAEGARS